MGLDSYLYRMPRYKGTTAHEVYAIEEYLNWQRNKAEGNEYANCTFEKWCGIDESELPSKEVVDYYKKFYDDRYYAWDTDHKYGHRGIIEQVGYWRKANQIHNFFIKSVQDGEDDCEYHHECTKEILEDLLNRCYKVLTGSVMVLGQVKNGQQRINGEWVDCMESGKVIINPEVAEELLPSTSGFFFGSTDYDEYYLQDIKDTIDIIENVLKTTDFKTQMLFYVSSW